MKTHIKIKESKNLIIPKSATPQSSGYDVVALEAPKIIGEIYKEATETCPALWKSIDYIEYKTGLFISPQQDTYGRDYHTLIFPRSSVRKYNLVLANSVGLIDNDYRGEIVFCFKYIWQPQDMFLTVDVESNGTERKTLKGCVDTNKIYKQGDKLGQLVSEITNTIEWIVVADLSVTVRGMGGFGSTTNKTIETPKESTSLVDKWKSVNADEIHTPPKYELITKEREKLMS